LFPRDRRGGGGGEPLVAARLKDVAKYSNQSVILFEKQNQLLGPLFGSEPPHSWCYYFGQAELARQMGEWEKVAHLGDVAFTLDDYPNDPFERFVFIEGYANVGDWKKAVELSTTSYKISKAYVGPSLCRLWARIERETQSTPEQASTLAEVRSKFECSP
jgi:hypothetical protein